MATPLSGTTMRRFNERLVLTCLRDEDSFSRSEIAERLGLAPAAVSRITNSLLERGLVEEAGLTAGSTGRPRTMLRLSRNWAGIGIDTRIDRAEIVCMQTGGRILARYPLFIPPRPEPDQYIGIITEAVAQLRSSIAQEITGLGMAFPGILTNQRRTVKNSHYLGWEDVPLQGPLEDALGLPVSIRHVAECAAMANARQPQLADSERLLHIQIGAGLGMALTRGHDVDDTLPVGWGGAGHVLLGPAERQCACGRFGCIDTVVGFNGFAEAGLRNGLTVPDTPDGMNIFARQIAELAEAKKGWAREAMDTLRKHLARVIAIFTSIEMPDAVTLGGYPVVLGAEFMRALDQDLERHLLAPSPLVATDLGDAASGLGAAMLGLAQIARPA